MADNSSKAYEIYRFIQDMQKEQIKNKTIKPEDVIKISENDFIKELQDTVNFYTKGTTNTRIIDDVYSNISTMIKNVSSIDEIISGKDIKIPVEVIAKSVDMAIQKNELNVLHANEEIKYTQTAIIIAQFEALKSPEEKIKFFESLSQKDKEDLARKVIGKKFGEYGDVISDAIIRLDEIKDEDINKGWTEDDIEISNKVNKDFNDIVDELGKTYRIPNIKELSFAEIAVLIDISNRIQDPNSNIEDIIEMHGDFLRKTYGADLTPSELIKRLSGKLSPESKEKINKKNNNINKRRQIISERKEYIQEFLKTVLPERVVDSLTEADYNRIFLTAMNEKGEFSSRDFVSNLRALQQKKPKDDPFWGDEEQFNSSLDNIRSNKDKLQESFEQGWGALKKNEATTLDGSNPQKPNASERDSKPVQEPVAPEVAKAASFFTFTANDMMSFAAFTPSIEMEQDKTDFMNVFASFAQIPDASVTPVYEASTDEIQVDPAIHGMVDEERPTPPVTEENETDVRGSGADGTTPPDVVTEETELDGDEDRDSPKDQETEENEKTQNTYGKDSFPGLIKAAEVTINDMRATQNELNPKDQNRINETNELDDDKDTK